jgi:hypothetical protein
MSIYGSEYYKLLREAHSAAEAVDFFDLHSKDPESMNLFRELQMTQHSANVRLAGYILSIFTADHRKPKEEKEQPNDDT